MARTDNLKNYLTDVAGAIKEKKGDDTPIQASTFDDEIRNLPTGGGGDDISEYINTEGVVANNTLIRCIKKLPDLDFSNTSKTSFNGFFEGSEIEEVPKIIMGNNKIDNMRTMFENCTNLKNIDNFISLDFSEVITLQDCFNGCDNIRGDINLDNLGTNKLNNISGMFKNCTNLKNISIRNLYLVKNSVISSVFYHIDNLITLDITGWNFDNLMNFSGFISNCNNLTTVIGEIDLINATNIGNFILNCNNLETVKIKNLGLNYDFIGKNMNGLSTESVDYMLNNVQDMTETPKTLTLGEKLYTKASPEAIASAEAKGWTINKERL